MRIAGCARRSSRNGRSVGGIKLPKALHVEDIASLEAVRYHIKDVQLMEGVDGSELPVMP